MKNGRSCGAIPSPVRRSWPPSNSSPRAPSSSAITTSAMMAAAIRMVSPARPFPWARASSPSPTCTTRSPRTGHNAAPSISGRRTSGWSRKRTTASMGGSSQSSSTRSSMRLLAHRLETERSARLAALAGQLGLVAGLTTLGCALGVAGDSLARPGSSLGHAFASGSVHAGFLSAGWILALHGRGGWQGPALRGAGALLVASLAAGLSPVGAVAYLLVPLVIVRDAIGWSARLEWIGWRAPRELRAPFVGAAVGIFLGLHLLFAASLMLGYPVAVPDGRRYLAAVAYDIGANALTAEWRSEEHTSELQSPYD